MVKPVPEGYHTVTPYLVCKGAAKPRSTIYKKAFGATELMRMPAPGGKIGHAEIKIGDSPIMLADEHPGDGGAQPEVHRRHARQHHAVRRGRGRRLSRRPSRPAARRCGR